MSRLTQPTVEAALELPHIAYAVFVDLDFVSGHFRAFSGVGQYEYAGQVFTGVGKLGGIGEINERVDPRDFAPLTLTLSGVQADLLQQYVPDRAEYFNRSATVYFVPFDTTTHAPLAAEPGVYEGFMDQFTFKREGATASCQMTIRHHSTDWQNTIALLHTHEHQRLIDNTDDSHNQTHTVEDKEIYWGGVPVIPGGTAGRGSGGDYRRRQLD